MDNLHVKIESGLAKTEVCIICQQGFTGRVQKLALTYDSTTKNQQDSSFDHDICVKFESDWSKPPYHANKVSQTDYKSSHWWLTLRLKIKRVPPFIMNSLCARFESDLAKAVACIMPTKFHMQTSQFGLDLWP